MRSFCYIQRFVLLLAGLVLTGCGKESPHSELILYVGTSADYAPFSYENEACELEGFDIELARRFAADSEMNVEFVRFRWPNLLTDLKAEKFDVAMSGVTVREDRSLAALFTVPVTKSEAAVIVPKRPKVDTMVGLDRAGIRIGVNRGGHLESVTRKAFSKATIVTSPDNQALPDLLLAGNIDALVTDTMEAPFWLKKLEGANALSPFTQDRKAWLVHPKKEELAGQLDEWLLGIEANGTLGNIRREYLPEGNDAQTATPLAALLAAMDERLSLMVGVAESKRVLGKPVEDMEQETRVLNSAVEGVKKEALRQGAVVPNEKAVRIFFKAQIEAAKSIQYRILKGPAQMTDPPDLNAALRPALGRISMKINRLILELQKPDSDSGLISMAAHVKAHLAKHEISEDILSAIDEGLRQLSE